MGLTTGIQYCDSTLNLMQGCDGCELWETKGKKKVKTCYAGNFITEHAGEKGFIQSFDKPEIFPDRIKYIAQWSDLSYKKRDGKTGNKIWLNGYPRIIFLNDKSIGGQMLSELTQLLKQLEDHATQRLSCPVLVSTYILQGNGLAFRFQWGSGVRNKITVLVSEALQSKIDADAESVRVAFGYITISFDKQCWQAIDKPPE